MTDIPEETKKRWHDSFKIFDQGYNFYVSKSIIGIKSNEDPEYLKYTMNPYVVMTAFSCELFLKSLAAFDGQPPARTHSLVRLYSNISTHHRNKIESAWNYYITINSALLDDFDRAGHPPVARNLNGALIHHDNIFVDYRYPYENTTGYFSIDSLSDILLNYIEFLHPFVNKEHFLFNSTISYDFRTL
jgi:hypothetical protein